MMDAFGFGFGWTQAGDKTHQRLVRPPDPCERPAQAARQVPQAHRGPRAEPGSGG
jgi:hypothetical protein